MATDISNLTSVVTSPVVLKEASGREAAQPHSQPAVATAGGAAAEGTSVKTSTGAAEAQARAETKAEQAARQAELEKQVQDLQDTASLKGWAVSFAIDKDTERTVIKVVDSETKETIRQIPSDEWLKTAKRLKEFSELNDKPQSPLPGLLFDKQV